MTDEDGNNKIDSLLKGNMKLTKTDGSLIDIKSADNVKVSYPDIRT